MRAMEEWLASEESGRAFTHCVSCRFPLLEISEPWLVNKEFHRGECTLEYAICQPCRDEVTRQLSESSRAAVRKFLETEIDWKARLAEFMIESDPVARFKECIACGIGRDEAQGFAISALFDAGGECVTGPLPLLMCSACVRKIGEAMSPESREVWQRFLKTHFTGPPESGFSGFL